jgi:hypothetical protein
MIFGPSQHFPRIISMYTFQLTPVFLPYRSSVQTLVWYTQVLRHKQQPNCPRRSDFHVRFSPRQRPNDLLLQQPGAVERDVLDGTHARDQDRVLVHRECETAREVGAMRYAGGVGEGPLQYRRRMRRSYRDLRQLVVLILR